MTSVACRNFTHRATGCFTDENLTMPHGLLADFVAAMTTHLKQGDRIRMSGLGILEVKTRAARTGRNPATGETIQIKAIKKVGFRPAKG
ncbi:MAG: HU family DNA-binding protein, partial [Pseudomonadota bacterium]|nr:HU family DNA-binding protein [Pseudomonadota bacterium]